ncbi:SMC family ATPase [Bacillaceae bacterium SIJ1]|uniref:AAA family ATPase n=1 Tax=Litoribacterium kuwaitense TaxID=1398745 RepID=UPI0013EBE64D|nr:SMC family ATPase [Litoribacterium kuwaitense]NGP44512.1 SMC family ATPase [Litoribacterium kuwaitense]
MRPVQLTIEGLNSFRQKQSIDFTALCEGGVFGIFGPTGSGKSSILDAMTLALYGKVERAEHNTYGIMNMNENTLQVSFTFCLENAEQAKTYRVERKYKRTGEQRMQTTLCRLLDVSSDSPVVLSDKATDVNDQIENLLGLTNDDFTRAVVLPQGKFAEFLSLKGSERRQMLQRLFQLQQYGDQLNQNVKNSKAETLADLKEMDAELSGIGDASSEAVATAESALKQAEKVENEARQNVEAVEKSIAFAKQVREWQQEERVAIAKIEELKKQEEGMASIQEKSNRAKEADTLKPQLDTLLEARKEKTEATQAKAVAVQAEEKATAEVEKHQASYEQVEKNYADAYPNLLQRQLRLENVAGIEERLTELKEQQTELTSQCKTYEKACAELQKENKVFAAKQIAEEEQSALLHKQFEEVMSNIPPEDILQFVNEYYPLAYEKKQVLDHRTEEWIEAKKEAVLTEQKLQKEQKQVESITHQLHEVDNQLQNRFMGATDQLRALKTVVQTVQKKIDQIESEEQRLQQEIMAKELAETLHHDQPCPVCGSHHHPAPATREVATSRAEHEKKQWSTVLQQMTQFQERWQQVVRRLQDCSDQLSQTLPTFARKIADAEGVHKNLPSMETKLTAVELLEEQALKEEESLKKEEAAVAKSARHLYTLMLQYTESQANAAAAKEQHLAALKRVEHKADEKHDAEQRNKEVETEWTSRCGNWLPLRNYDRAKKEMDSRLETKAKLEASLHESHKKIESMKQQQADNRHALERHQLSLQYRQESKRKVEAEITEGEAKIKAVLDGENNVKEALQSIENKMNVMHHHRKKAEQACNEARQAQVEADQKLQRHREWERRAQAHETNLQKRFAEALQASSFQSERDVQQAIVTNEQKSLWDDQLTAFHEEWKEAKTTVERLRQKRGSSFVSEEAWNELLREKAYWGDQWRKAVEHKGFCDQALSTLRKKHDRFTLIQRKRKQCQSDFQNLETLEKVLKGNSFVEFIAEEQLMNVCIDATSRLRELTKGRYAVEVDSAGGFVIRDDLTVAVADLSHPFQAEKCL